MAARAYWQGQIRLALVSIPVEIYPATKSGATVSFRQIHEPSGKPIHYEKVVTGIGPVDADEIMKGYEYEKGEYVLLDQDEIDAVKLESKKTLELTQFVDAHEIDVLYYEKPYRSEEHTSELQSLMRISYAVFCLKKKKTEHARVITKHIYSRVNNKNK